jgi:pentatricopeptide repeat protein
LADLRVRVQLCGGLCVEIDGGRRESRLPGPQGRRLFAYLATHRLEALTRQHLAALWAPFRESGYRVLMAALAARGNTADALRVYDDLMRLLSDELGIIPSKQTRELHAQLLRSGSR